MVYSQDFYVATVIREWFGNHYQARPRFMRAQREYLQDIHCRLGGCPAVVLPNQRAEDAQALLGGVLSTIPKWLKTTFNRRPPKIEYFPKKSKNDLFG